MSLIKSDQCFIIAEMSANHNNDIEVAKRTIEAISKSGANAVKIQTYKPESLTLNLNKGLFGPKRNGIWKGYTPWDLYKIACMPYKWQPTLKKTANDLGLEFFSSPFDIEGVDFLDEILNVNLYKVASFEITDINLIKHIASKQKPIIISTGLAELKDIELAIETCKEQGNNQIILLKCTSEYPAKLRMANLRTIPMFIEKFKCKVGVSDHTMGDIVPLVSVSLGAKVIEKHFILDRSMGGPDSSFSMEPQEFLTMVNRVREAESTLGNVKINISDSDKLRRRSLFISKDIKKGECFSNFNVKSIRPGHGLHPKYLYKVIGRKSIKSIEMGSPLSEDMIEGGIQL